MFKVCTVVGTRPEIIKLSEVIKALDLYTEHTLVHTGQHYDANLSDVFFEDLELRKPDLYLDAAGASAVELIGSSLGKFDKLLSEKEFDAVLVYGDTNSAICTYAAKRRQIPIFHMEAGNRCFDARVPEEINRKIIDHLADVNLTITEHARRNLLREGLDPQYTYKVGSSMPEVLGAHQSKIKLSTAAEDRGLREGDFYIVSIHREENTAREDYLDTLAETLERLLESKDVFLPLHPKTARLFASRFERIRAIPYLQNRLIVSGPVGFIDFISLQLKAACTISDSGTIFEESAILGFPAITVRDSTERPEGLDAGVVTVCRWNASEILSAVAFATRPLNSCRLAVEDYDAPDLSTKVVNLLISLTPKIRAQKYYSEGRVAAHAAHSR